MSTYRPYVLSPDAPHQLCSPDYVAFLKATTLEAGLRLFRQRYERRPDFPYPDTKFNPNDGQDLPESNYNRLIGWFVGRGGEAFATHATLVDQLEGLGELRRPVEEMCGLFVDSCREAILAALERNAGRCPFLMDRTFHAIDAHGVPVKQDTTGRDPTDLFAAKALIASGDSQAVQVGKDLLRDFVRSGLELRYRSESSSADPDVHSESWTMLSFGAIPLVMGRCVDSAEALQWAQVTAEMLRFVLTRHYDSHTAAFYEFVSTDAATRRPYAAPGHVSELVGLGLQAIEAVSATTTSLPQEVTDTFLTAFKEFPRLLVRTFDLGYNRTHHGLHQGIDSHSGEVLNDQMPWWSLPETMRAAVRTLLVVDKPDTREALMRIAITCSNAYFRYYINPNLLLFPFRTRSGATGEVVNIMPVVPEADPLYHTNLALIDMMNVAHRLDL